MKKFINVFLGFLTIVSLSFPNINLRAAVTNSEPFKAITKIGTFTVDVDGNLVEVGSGSGVIISSSGLLLTNQHVIKVVSFFDGSPEDGAYLICLPSDTVNEPDCSYTAKYIASDEDLDIALLQIQNIPSLSNKTDFPYLELNQSDTTNINDPITAIGYPGIGGSTVTSTQGNISGKIDKYGKQWIKTDAVISFGSSGGAALDASNKVIGITSAGHSDLLGSLGYITNITSLNTWISSNISKLPTDLVLNNRMIKYAEKEKAMNQSNIFENINPRFSVSKPSSWEFSRSGENEFYITDPADEDGGEVKINIIKHPYLVDINSIAPYLRRLSSKTLNDSLYKLQENSTIKIGNTTGKRIRFVDITGQNKMYAIPIRNYIVLVTYAYGLDDNDKNQVEGIIQSLNVFKDSTPFKEQKSYTHTDPYFSIVVDRDWVIQQREDKRYPIIILNKKYRDFYIDVDIRRTDDTTKSMSQDALLNYYKESADSFNKTNVETDLKIDWTETAAHFRTGGKIDDVIKGLTTIKSRSSNKILGYEYGFTKKLNDKYIINISMYYDNADKKALATYRAEFSRLMKNFIISKPQAKKDTDGDGLNDEDEKKYKTNPNKKDTDGDGYSDWEEIKSGYNPLGKGKLKK